MNTQSFLENFGYLANAPDGVKRLREIILQLAAAAKLTERDESDTEVNVLFVMNQEHRERLVAAKEVRPQKSVLPINDDETPWVLPATWKWCRLGQVTSYGSTDKAEFSDVTDQTWVLELEDIEKETSKLLTRVRASERKFRSTKNCFNKGHVLYGKLRPYLDKVLVADEDGVCTTEIIPILCFEGVVPEYLRLYLKSPNFVSYANNSTHGMNLPRLGTEPARAALFALPPLEEQKRIVAKVDELMALCDKLEAQQLEREGLFPILSRANHTRFAESPSPENLNAIFDEAGNVSPEDLRKTILDMAVQGKLVAQIRSTVSGKKLIEEIQNTRDELIERGQIPRRKPCRSWTEDELPFSAPDSWGWCMLGEITDIGTGSTPSRDNSQFWHSGTIPWVTSGSTSSPRISAGDEFVTEDAVKAHRLRIYKPGTLLVALYGQGKTRGQVSTLEIESTINQALSAICPIEDYEEVQDYLKLLLRRNYDVIRLRSAGGAQPNLNVQKIKEIFVPVPPIEEQRRIVSKVDQLMALVDQLEKQKAQKSEVAAAYAQATVATITGIQTKESEPMKAPKTELITKLETGNKLKDTDEAPLANLIAKQKNSLSAKALWQQSGLEIDTFYQQLKTEMANGWIVESEPAFMKEVEAT